MSEPVVLKTSREYKRKLEDGTEVGSALPIFHYDFPVITANESIVDFINSNFTIAVNGRTYSNFEYVAAGGRGSVFNVTVDAPNYHGANHIWSDPEELMEERKERKYVVKVVPLERADVATPMSVRVQAELAALSVEHHPSILRNAFVVECQ